MKELASFLHVPSVYIQLLASKIAEDIRGLLVFVHRKKYKCFMKLCVGKDHYRWRSEERQKVHVHKKSLTFET